MYMTEPSDLWGEKCKTSVLFCPLICLQRCIFTCSAFMYDERTGYLERLSN